LGAAFIARLILALSDSLDATTFVVEAHNTKNETSNNLIAFITKSPHKVWNPFPPPSRMLQVLLNIGHYFGIAI
jgi:hypothetical protein